MAYDSEMRSMYARATAKNAIIADMTRCGIMQSVDNFGKREITIKLVDSLRSIYLVLTIQFGMKANLPANSIGHNSLIIIVIGSEITIRSSVVMSTQ